MSLIAFAAPILPGKREQWNRFIEQLNGPRHAEFEAANQRAGVHERTFLQVAPDGTELVIVTLEGDHPETAKLQTASEDTDFARWFVQQVQEIHGFDLREPLPGPPPAQVAETAAPAGATQDDVNVLRRVIDELINGKNLSSFDELFTPDFVEHELAPGMPEGREGTKLLFAALHAAFPDIHVEIEDIVAQGDRVVFRMIWQGTQTGEFMGIPPTGKRATWDVFDVVRIEDGKIAEHWGLMDQLSLMQQLGVIPAAEPATV